MLIVPAAPSHLNSNSSMISTMSSVQSQRWRARDCHKGMNLMTMKKMLMSEAKSYRCDFDVAKCERALASEMKDLRKEFVSIKVD